MGKDIKNFNEDKYTDEFIKSLYTKKYHKNYWDVFRLKNLNAAKIIHETLLPKSVVDFGCSIGTYLEYYQSQGCKIQGYEYCYDECVEHIKKVSNLINYIEFGDVSKPILVNEKFELASSIEVAEHIITSKSDVFVDNLCKSSYKYVFLTAAQVGQGGTGHINCQPKSFWINKFKNKGWLENEGLEDKMREIMIPSKDTKRNDYPIVWPFVFNNLMVFEKTE